MADYGKASSSFLSSPRLLTAFASKGFTTDSESLMSPTSTLDSKPFSAFRNPFWSDSSASPRTPKPENKVQWEKLDSRGVGLGILDALTDEKSDAKLLLKVQIPPLLSTANSSVDYPKCPLDFGVKTRSYQVGSLSPSCMKKSSFESTNSGLENTDSPVGFHGLSITDMELSEDYTCVMSHGPNPKTTHIFDDCIVESCCGVVGASLTRNREESLINHSMSFASENFLSVCYNCKKNLGQGKDIYIYRGDEAFCSSDCRFKQMIRDGGLDESDDINGTSS